MRTFKYFLIGISFIALSSCSTISRVNSTPPTNKTETVEKRVETLSTVQSWNIKGLIAVRNNVKPDNLSASLNWQQVQNTYQITLFGPLGAGGVELKGVRGGSVSLKTSDGKVSHAASPENLLAQQTNWRLPVSNMYYWVRGMAAPSSPAQKKFDAYNHLSVLQQDGWRIQYLSYTSVKNIDVPNRITLTNASLFVKLVIKQWNF